MHNIIFLVQGWNPKSLVPQLTTLIITTIIIVSLSILYYFKVKKAKPGETPRGIVFFVELIVKSVENLVVSVMGKKYRHKLTPYVLYLITYLSIGNLLSLIGLDSQFSSYTVTLSLGLVTFIGTYIIGIRLQKFMFLRRYLYNPAELISQFGPLLSISFRLFGNVLAGSIILALIYQLLNHLWGFIPIFGQVDLLAGLIAPVLHTYFDIFDGVIQAFIFTILTISYWRLEMADAEEMQEKKAAKKAKRQLKLQQKIAAQNAAAKKVVPIQKEAVPA